MTSVARITNISEINEALNEPSVISACAPGYISLDAHGFTDPRHVALRYGDAVALFINHNPGVYEAHYAFPPTIRGKVAFEAAKNILNEMFTTYRAETILGVTPRDFLAARNLNYRLGFRKIGAKLDQFGRECVVCELRSAVKPLH